MKFIRTKENGFVVLRNMNDVENFFYSEEYECVRMTEKSAAGDIFSRSFAVLKADGTFCGSLDELPDCIVEL